LLSGAPADWISCELCQFMLQRAIRKHFIGISFGLTSLFRLICILLNFCHNFRCGRRRDEFKLNVAYVTYAQTALPLPVRNLLIGLGPSFSTPVPVPQYPPLMPPLDFLPVVCVSHFVRVLLRQLPGKGRQRSNIYGAGLCFL